MLQDILLYLETGWNFIVNIFESFLAALTFLFSSSSFLYAIQTYCPYIIGLSLSITVALSVIKFIVGR